MTDDSPKIIPFGKHRGRLVEEVLADDPGYLEWLSGQPWFRDKYNILYQVIINRGAEPEETPDHNAMQVRFLDDEFCVNVLGCVDPQCWQKAATALRSHHAHNLKLIGSAVVSEQESLTRAKENIARYVQHMREHPDDDSYYSRCLAGAEKDRDLRVARIEYLFRVQKEFTPPIEALQTRVDRQFEERGVDVVLSFSAKSANHSIEPPRADDLDLRWYRYDKTSYGEGWHDLSCNLGSLRIELKPVIGDDYPAVLRQMKANGSSVLFVGEYAGQGATQEQFVKTMATAGIRVVFARDVES